MGVHSISKCAKLHVCRRVHEKILDSKKYKCELCNHATTDNFRLRAHLKKQHGMERDEALEDFKNEKKLNMTR